MFDSNLTPDQKTAKSVDRLNALTKELTRIDLLSGEDRMLAEMRFQGRLSHRRVASALGLSPGQASRRAERLLARLRDPIVAALLDTRGKLTEGHRRIGIEHFLRGQSVLQIARQRAISRQRVQTIIAYIRGYLIGKHISERGLS